jgi:hypothetical protein
LELNLLIIEEGEGMHKAEFKKRIENIKIFKL